MALFIKRKPNQAVVIGDNVTVFVASIKDGEVELGFDAPRTIDIRRREAPNFLRHNAHQDGDDHDNRGNR